MKLVHVERTVDYLYAHDLNSSVIEESFPWCCGANILYNLVYKVNKEELIDVLKSRQKIAMTLCIISSRQKQDGLDNILETSGFKEIHAVLNNKSGNTLHLYVG